MSVQLLPVAFAGAFVVGCLAIRALENWSDQVTSTLAWIFTVVIILLGAQVMAYKVPHRSVSFDAKPVSPQRLPYGTGIFDHKGPTTMRATPINDPTVFGID